MVKITVEIAKGIKNPSHISAICVSQVMPAIVFKSTILPFALFSFLFPIVFFTSYFLFRIAVLPHNQSWSSVLPSIV